LNEEKRFLRGGNQAGILQDHQIQEHNHTIEPNPHSHNTFHTSPLFLGISITKLQDIKETNLNRSVNFSTSSTSLTINRVEPQVILARKQGQPT